jgi:hypothetical protein
MNYVGKLARGFKEFYNEINPATLTGKILESSSLKMNFYNKNNFFFF